MCIAVYTKKLDYNYYYIVLNYTITACVLTLTNSFESTEIKYASDVCACVLNIHANVLIISIVFAD